MYEDFDNGFIAKDDVPETSEEELIETDTSEEVEDVQNTTETVERPSEDDIEKIIEERANQIAEEKIEARLIRDRVKRERESSQTMTKYEELTNMMKSALGAKDIDDVITKSREFYKEQGMPIPEIINKPSLNERDEIVLAKADANDIIKLGEDEMKMEANRISNIPRENWTIRDKTIFEEVCKELTLIKDTRDLKSKGYDTKILDDKDFLSFKEQFNFTTPVSQIYEMYNKMHGSKKVQPKSPGSAKTTQTNNEIKDYYTPEEARVFNEEDLNNPKLMKALELSMQKWGKNK